MNYSMAINLRDDGQDVYLDIKDEEIANIIASIEKDGECEVTPDYVKENEVNVRHSRKSKLVEVMKSYYVE